MDYDALLDNLALRPGMFLPAPTYDCAASFVYGLDAGNEWGLLFGFREWLQETRKVEPSLAWHGMVLDVAFPGRWPDWVANRQSKDDDRAAIRVMCSLLKEFLAIRRSRDLVTVTFRTKKPIRRSRRR